MRPYESLARFGFAVVGPIPGDLTQYRREFDRTIVGFPEFVGTDARSKYVLGGFSAYGNPASFHNELVRTLREVCMHLVIREIFQDMFRRLPGEFNLEQVVDRMMKRLQGLAPTKESWHVDNSVGTLPDDTVFGGWLNLDDTPQYFSCIPGSQGAAEFDGSGFVCFDKRDKEMMGFFRGASERVAVPPRCVLVFDERLVHEVCSEKAIADTYRLFLGWRVTRSRESMIPALDRLIDTQAVMPLKSGQIPPMYPKLYWVNYRDALVEFSNRVVPSCREVKTVGSGECAGQELDVVARTMPSLHSIGAMYRPYSRAERDMLIPGREWMLRPCPDSQPEIVRL